MYNWTWAKESELSKLLKTPFGLNLKTRDVDKFLINKMSIKLGYYITMKLIFASRAIIVNQVLFFTLWFLVFVWGGFGKPLRKICNILRNYLWSRKNKEPTLR